MQRRIEIHIKMKSRYCVIFKLILHKLLQSRIFNAFIPPNDYFFVVEFIFVKNQIIN